MKLHPPMATCPSRFVCVPLTRTHNFLHTCPLAQPPPPIRVSACMCGPPDSPCNHPLPPPTPHTVTRWLSVGACQGLCGLRKAAQPFPFPGACSAPAWPRTRTVFMSCVIADLSLSRRPASVRMSSRSPRARSKSHHLPQSDHVSHNPPPLCSELVPLPRPPPTLTPPRFVGRKWWGGDEMKVPPRAALRPLEKRVQQTCIPNTLFLNRNPPPPPPPPTSHGSPHSV